MTPKMLLEDLQIKLGEMAVNLHQIPQNSTEIQSINESIEDVIMDLQVVRDYLKVGHQIQSNL
ncbi:MAG: hypothetical protein ACFHVJ_07005 [Aestuariibacter sp.]